MILAPARVPWASSAVIERVAGAIYADRLDHIEVAHNVVMRGDVVVAVLADGSREPFRIGCIRP